MKIDFSKFYEILSPGFWPVFENKERIRVLMGGAGSGKSFFIFQEMIFNIVSNACNYLVVRQTANSNRTSTYALTKKIINDFNLSSIFKENKSEMTFTCTINDAMVVFRGLEDVERLKSISFPGGSGILERVIFEESSEGNFQSFSQLNIRLRGKSKNYFQISLLLNPISSTNWIKKTFFDRNEFKAFIHHSTYKDNPFLDKDYVKTLEAFKSIDLNFYNIYCLGQWGVTTGLVFNNWQVSEIPFDTSQLDESEILSGCDWGYNHPTALSLSYIKDNILYTFDELIAYETTNPEFIEIVKEQNFISKSQKVVYDPEDPARGREFINNGFSFLPAKKGKGSVNRTIDYIKSFKKWIISPKCIRLKQELEQYHWRLDKDGNPMDEPVALVDDCIASVRYAIEHLANMKGKPSTLSGSKSDQKKKMIEMFKQQRREKREAMKALAKQKREEDKALLKK